MCILDLVKELDSSLRNTTAIVSVAITGLVLFVGAYGSYRHDRATLSTFAVIGIVAVIVGFVSKASIYLTLGPSILLIVLALAQSELIKRGYH